MNDLVRRHARASHRRQRLTPTSGRRKRRNSVKACHTSWRLRYSKLTSRLTWLEGGARRRRKMRSRRVRYRPLYRKTKKEAKAAIEWVVDTMEDIRESDWTLVLGCRVVTRLVDLLVVSAMNTYLIVSALLINKPIFPLAPAIASTDSQNAIDRFLPSCGNRKNRPLMSSICVPQIHKGSTVGSIVVPDCQLEEDRA